MESVLNSVLVTEVFIVITCLIGWRIGRSGKPYGEVKLLAHIFLFLLIAVGVLASLYKLHAVTGNKLFTTLALYLAMLTIITNFVVGMMMTIKLRPDYKLVKIHKISTSVMVMSILSAVLFLMIKI